MLLDSLHEGVQVISHDYRYVFVNPSAAKHGKTIPEMLVGRTMMECYPGIDATPFFRMLQSCLTERTSHVIDNAFLFPDGELRWFELRIEPVLDGACVLSLDVTDRKMSDAALRATDEHRRRAAQEREIRAAIEGSLETIEPITSALAASTSRAHDDLLAQTRVRVEELRAYAQLRESHTRITDPADVLGALEARLEREHIGNVTCARSNEVSPQAIVIDPESIVVVLLALIHYLRRLPPESCPVAVSFETVLVSADDALIDPELTPGRHIVFSVGVEGFALDEATLATMFHLDVSLRSTTLEEPLGLAGARGIVGQNHGVLRAQSRVGLGTTFELRFPGVAP